ncbi:HlyD family efflux transporter periplasmic adaptor subunit [Thalassomonas haliotis]|uniref:HlyD family efflux transporter periplasmic adaptor subunit n=1 Tax=Thalassomonas haliotis TaxID=485448 RepID=A0ABY7VM68_9GAMM|nr:HlyD family efflux transporter periplasmic adaptor subunit [Thalassomonas haliotis]WDE14095.1 HlyD family efflux transporter periplasmic adaptor subunit [Thalassomonas haliotis]
MEISSPSAKTPPDDNIRDPDTDTEVFESHPSREGDIRESQFNQEISPEPDSAFSTGDAAPDKVSAELKTLASNWLNWQASMVSGALCGGIFLPVNNTSQRVALLAQFPQCGGNLVLLEQVASLSLESGKHSIRHNQIYTSNQGQTCDLLACPLMVDNKASVVVALAISPRSKPQCHAVIQLLEWGMLWLETLLRQEVAYRREQSAIILNLIHAVLGHNSVKAAALETANVLATQLSCERVSIGLCYGLSARLLALSHIAHFERDREFIREIEAVMNEAIDQSCHLLYRQGVTGSGSVMQAHARLAKQQGNKGIHTRLLGSKSAPVGAISCELGDKTELTKENLALFETVSRLLGPIFELRMKNEASWLTKTMSALRLSVTRLLGGSYLKVKIASLSVMLVLLGLSVMPGTFEVKASAALQGKVRQLLVAPQDGFIKKGMVSAGDLVEQGNLLATLDDSRLRLERQKWQSEHNKLKKQYQQAFSARERAQLGILQARLDQVSAEMQLVDEQISRTRLKAPFDGIVLSGDLDQAQGSPVTKGQVLFEVTPLNHYRVLLEVDEHDIARLKSGQAGTLIMTALPDTRFNITLEKVIPVAISSDGYNYFRVQARLKQPSSLLRPGMRGVAKITIEERKLLWIWTHELRQRLSLWLWSLGVPG